MTKPKPVPKTTDGVAYGHCLGCWFEAKESNNPPYALYTSGLLCAECLPVVLEAIKAVAMLGGANGIVWPDGTYGLSFDVGYGLRKATRAGWLAETDLAGSWDDRFKRYTLTDAGQAALTLDAVVVLKDAPKGYKRGQTIKNEKGCSQQLEMDIPYE